MNDRSLTKSERFWKYQEKFFQIPEQEAQIKLLEKELEEIKAQKKAIKKEILDIVFSQKNGASIRCQDAWKFYKEKFGKIIEERREKTTLFKEVTKKQLLD